MAFSTNQTFDFIDDPNLDENVKKLETKKFGFIYLQKEEEYFLSAGKSECYKFVNNDHPELYDETMTTIKNFFGVFYKHEDFDSLIDELTKIAYSSGHSKNCTKLRFNENPMINKHKEFLIENIFDISNVLNDGGVEIFFSNKFLKSEEEMFKIFREDLEKKLFDFNQIKIPCKNFIFFIDDNFDKNELEINSTSYTESFQNFDNIKNFMKKIKYVVNHPKIINEISTILENEIKDVAKINEFESKLLAKSLKLDIADELSKKEGNFYDFKRVDDFFKEFHALIKEIKKNP